MKRHGVLITLLFALSVLLIGCSNGESQMEKQKREIRVEENTGSGYSHYRDVSDTDQVNRAVELLGEADWEDAEVNMETAPSYKFHMNPLGKGAEAKSVEYVLWISPGGEKVELEIQDDSNYVQLPEDESAELFEIITGKTLSGSD